MLLKLAGDAGVDGDRGVVATSSTTSTGSIVGLTIDDGTDDGTDDGIVGPSSATVAATGPGRVFNHSRPPATNAMDIAATASARRWEGARRAPTLGRW